MRPLVSFFRANPQALVLLLICLILGIGTFVAVLFALAGDGNGSPNGAVDGVIAIAGAIGR